jgi:SlyX protein
MSEQRIIELEIKASYQEELIDSLNQIVANQQNQICRLEQTCKLLHDKIKAVSTLQPGNDPVDELPPHY